jgi:hypothetical protein
MRVEVMMGITAIHDHEIVKEKSYRRKSFAFPDDLKELSRKDRDQHLDWTLAGKGFGESGGRR